MARQLYAIGQYHMIAQNTIVGHMRIGHQQAMTAHHRFPFILCATVYRYTFTNGSKITDLYRCIFTNKFQVLGNGA